VVRAAGLAVGPGGVKEVDTFPVFVSGEPAVGQRLAEQSGYAVAVGIRGALPLLSRVVSWHAVIVGAPPIVQSAAVDSSAS
jgi:hypothetical protein